MEILIDFVNFITKILNIYPENIKKLAITLIDKINTIFSYGNFSPILFMALGYNDYHDALENILIESIEFLHKITEYSSNYLQVIEVTSNKINLCTTL